MSWPVPKFAYGQRVTVKPLRTHNNDPATEARVVDLHFFGIVGTVEYDVRYFVDGKEVKIRVFEDELDGDD